MHDLNNAMKISIQELWQNMVATSRRFPLAVTDSVIVTLLALALYSLSSKESVLQELLLTAVLGFPLLISLALFTEGRAVPEKLRLLTPFLAVLFLAFHYFFTRPRSGARTRSGPRPSFWRSSSSCPSRPMPAPEASTRSGGTTSPWSSEQASPACRPSP